MGIDWKKVGKGALIAIGGALLSYGTNEVVPYFNEVGTPGALSLAAAFSTGINFTLKLWQAKFGKPNA